MSLQNLRHYRRSLLWVIGLLAISLILYYSFKAPRIPRPQTQLISRPLPLPAQPTQPTPPQPMTSTTPPTDLTTGLEEGVAHSSQLQPSSHTPAITTPTSPTQWHHLVIQSSDTLAGIFHRYHIHSQELALLLKNKLAATHLAHLTPGQALQLLVAQDHTLQSLNLQIDHMQTLTAVRVNDEKSPSFHTNINTLPITTTVKFREGIIHHNLSAAAQTAGLTSAMISELAHIFTGSINFARDFHNGDRFQVLYQELYADGKALKPGPIVAARFITKEKTITALRYTSPKGVTGYYTPQGEGVQPMLLRAPLHYTHISSTFSTRRWQPILHIWRPHLAIDYAAPSGTPIHAAGNGRVIFEGQQHGYGNVIMIDHGNHYTTLYAHLRRFSPILQDGRTVHKGQVIGYVGMTGLATGPHLHYEIRHFGLHLNPLTAKIPGDSPIPYHYYADFRRQAHYLLDLLQLYSHPSELKSLQHV